MAGGEGDEALRGRVHARVDELELVAELHNELSPLDGKELKQRAESAREWIHVVRGRDDEGLLLAADYAKWGPVVKASGFTAE